MPCFDQPDIKGVMTLEVITHEHWSALANAKVDFVEDGLDPDTVESMGLGYMADFFSRQGYTGLKRFVFEPTPKLSSYLWTVNVGSYVVKECEDSQVPIKLATRRGQYYEESVAHCFEICKAAVAFYEHIFACPYPFSKLDLVLVPMVRYTAMECAGCIVYGESMIGAQNWANLTHGAIMNSTITILHEVSHMWFGNMVTMEWWSDLWLNESFATIISHMAYEHLFVQRKSPTDPIDVSAGTQETPGWMTFCKEKTKGYKDDLEPTTHPIEASCETSDQAEMLLDGITYGKGACWARQLIMRIGLEKFLQGLSNYFNEFKWSNSTLDDFIRCMQQVYEPNSDSLTEFSSRWLKRQGVNSFTVREEQGTLILTQGFMDFADQVIKEQIVNILAVLSDDFSQTYLFENVLISGQSTETVIELPEHICNDVKAYVLNYNELAYGIFYPD